MVQRSPAQFAFMGSRLRTSVWLFFDYEYAFNLLERAGIGEHGWYEFHGLAPCKYKIFAYDPKNSGGAWTSESLVLYNSATEKIEVNARDKITLDLKLLP